MLRYGYIASLIVIAVKEEHEFSFAELEIQCVQEMKV